MMIHGPGVANMYSTIVDGRRIELLSLNVPQETINEQLTKFAVDIKYVDRNDFDEMYELYKDLVISQTKRKN